MNKLGKHFFIYHSWYTFNFDSAYKKPPLIKVAIFSCVILVLSTYRICKQKAIKLIPYYMIDRQIYYFQNRKTITYEKLRYLVCYLFPPAVAHI